jgi:hypothetical protein
VIMDVLMQDEPEYIWTEYMYVETQQ